MAPVIVAGLTPLAILSAHGVSDSKRELLAVSPAAGILFALVVLSLLRDAAAFFRLHLPIRIGDWEMAWLPRRRALMIVGLLVITYGAVTNLYVTA